MVAALLFSAAKSKMPFQIEIIERELKLLEQFKVQPEDQVRVTEHNLRKTVDAVVS